MPVHPHSRIVCSSFAILSAGSFAAPADLSIAKRATQNVSCTGGRCVATAPNAVLNLLQLQSLLAKYPTVFVDAGPAQSMAVDGALTWTSNATLSLTAHRALTISKPVTVAGPGGVKIHTADDGLSFAPEASVSFWSLSSALTINDVTYTLVGDLKTIFND